jgi:hypothetical protein
MELILSVQAIASHAYHLLFVHMKNSRISITAASPAPMMQFAGRARLIVMVEVKATLLEVNSNAQVATTRFAV